MLGMTCGKLQAKEPILLYWAPAAQLQIVELQIRESCRNQCWVQRALVWIKLPLSLTLKPDSDPACITCCSVGLLDERYFGELCFYTDAHDALLRNAAALLDAHAFGEAFDATLEAMDAWKTVRPGPESGSGSGSRLK